MNFLSYTDEEKEVLTASLIEFRFGLGEPQVEADGEAPPRHLSPQAKALAMVAAKLDNILAKLTAPPVTGVAPHGKLGIVGTMDSDQFLLIWQSERDFDSNTTLLEAYERAERIHEAFFGRRRYMDFESAEQIYYRKHPSKVKKLNTV